MLFFMTAPKRSAPQRAIRAPVTEDVVAGGSAAYDRETAWPSPEPRRRVGGNGGRGDARLLCLPRGALAADSHQQPARAHPARESTKRYLNIELLKGQQMKGATTG
jgi:hypothetical protein